MTNKWVEHVKEFAKSKGITYKEAIKNPECKNSYKGKNSENISMKIEETKVKRGRPKKYSSPEEKVKTTKKSLSENKIIEGGSLETKIAKHLKNDNKKMKILAKAFSEHKKIEHQVDTGKGLVVDPLSESTLLYPLSHDNILKMLKHLL